VKPGDIHSYQSHRECTEFFGIVLPGSWIEFFAAAGEDWDNEAYPAPGTHPFDFGRMMAAMAKHDVNLVREATYAPADLAALDRALPGAHQSYFLESRQGMRQLLGGHISFALATGAETQGRFSMRMIEGRSGAEIPRHVHNRAYEVIYVLRGQLQVDFATESHVVPAGGMVSLPAGVEHRTLSLEDRTGWISAHSDPAADVLFDLAGALTDRFMHPGEVPALPDIETLKVLCAGSDIIFV